MTVALERVLASRFLRLVPVGRSKHQRLWHTHAPRLSDDLVYNRSVCFRLESCYVVVQLIRSCGLFAAAVVPHEVLACSWPCSFTRCGFALFLLWLLYSPVVTAPNRVGAIYATLQEALWAHARIAIHLGKTKVWNASGIRPEICTVPERMARETDRTARVWRGSEVPEDEHGMKVLGTPLGHPQYVCRFLSQLSEKHKVLLRRIPRLDDVQSAWLLLAHCAAARANYSLRCVEPQDVDPFARTHDFQMRQFGRGRPVTLPLSLERLGLRSALRTSKAAYWASWADCLAMISERHPEVAQLMVDELEGVPRTSCLEAAA